MSALLPDALLLLRASVAAATEPSLTPTASLDTATALTFPALPPLSTAPTTIPLSTLTRFVKDGSAVDLRSIYSAWLQRETTIAEYIASAQAMGVTNLGFFERLELVTYIDGGQEESDHILPLPKVGGLGVGIGGGGGGGGGSGGSGIGGADVKRAGDDPRSGAVGDVGKLGSQNALLGKVRNTDPRLLDIYAAERVVTNRNVMLRGIKPTVWLPPSDYCLAGWLIDPPPAGFLPCPQTSRRVHLASTRRRSQRPERRRQQTHPDVAPDAAVGAVDRHHHYRPRHRHCHQHR